MSKKERMADKQVEQSKTESIRSTQASAQQVFATEESQDETQEIGKTDSHLEMDQAIL